MPRAAWTLLALFVLTRLALVASVADVFGYGEELGKGAAAKALLDGLPVEHHRLAYVYHEGGGFVVTHLKALAFLLVGESVLAHKLVALVTGGLVLLVGLRLASVHFGARAAWSFGLAFVFAPESFLRFSLLSLGTHFEIAIFLGLAFHFTLRIAARERATARTWIALGLVFGFGTYFSLVMLAAIAWSGLVLLASARRELDVRRIGAACAGALVGALPLWWMMSRVGLDAVRVRAREGGTGSGVTRLEAARDLLSAFTRGDVGPWLLAVGYIALLALGWSALRRGDATRRRKVLLLASFVPVFLALYLASGLAIRPDVGWFFFLRLAPVWFALTLLAGACGGAALERGGAARCVAIGAVALVAGVGAFDAGRLVRAGDPAHPLANLARVATTKGYDYAEYFDKLQHHLDGTLEEKIAVLLHYDDDPELLLPAINLSLFEHAGLSLDAAVALSERAYGERSLVALQGLRFFVHPHFGHDIPHAFRVIEPFPPEQRRALAVAIGRAGLGPRFLPERIRQQVELEVPADLREPYLEGAGWRVQRAFPLRPDRAAGFIASLRAPDRPAVERGRAGAERGASVRR